MNDSDKPSNFLQDIFVFTFATSIIVFGLWWVARPAIMWASFWTSYHLFGVYQHLSFLMTSNELHSIVVARNAIKTINPSQYGIKALLMLMEQHGYVWRAVAIPLMLGLAFRESRKVVRFKYNRNIKDVYDLIAIQAKHFPASAVVHKKNILAMHPHIGPWATYVLPIDFALDNQMLWTRKTLVEPDETPDETKMLAIPAFSPDEKLLKITAKRSKLPHYRYVAFSLDRAEKVFTAQLGPLWQGADALPPLEKALYAIFITQGSGEQAEAWAMIEQVAFSWVEGSYDGQGKLVTPHRANTAGVDKLIAKYGAHPRITEITQRHAHTYNVLAELMTWARSAGRLMHSNLLWMRPVNKDLYFLLASQDGQCPFWEVAGLWAHSQIEKLQGKAITIPMVAGAVIEFRKVMSIEHWIDPGEHSEEAQKRRVREANDLLRAEQEEAARGNKPGPPRKAAQATQPPAQTPYERVGKDDET